MPSKSKITVTCPICNKSRDLVADYYSQKRKEHGSICRKCSIHKFWETKTHKTIEEKIEYRKQYYQNNKSKSDKRSTEWREAHRLKVIEFLGGKCNKCGNSNPIVLAIDHINDDGASDRKKYNKCNAKFLNDILNGVVGKDRVQLLCCNCNWEKEYYRRKNAIKK